MKLLAVVHQFLPRHVTGTEQYVRAIVLAMRSAGVDARVFAYEPLVQHDSPDRNWVERDEVVEGIPVRRVGLHHSLSRDVHLRDYDNPMAARALARQLDEFPCDVVHVFHPRNIGRAVVDEPASRGIPVVVNLMDFWWVCPNYLLLRSDGALCDGPPARGLGCVSCIDPALAGRLEQAGMLDALGTLADAARPAGNHSGSDPRKALALVGRKEHLFSVLNRADRVVAPSRFLAGIYRQHGLDPARLVHLPYGLDHGRFAATAPRHRPASRDTFDVGYIGSITRHKGLHVLLDALGKTSSKRVRLHVHGSRESQPGWSDVLVDGICDPRATFHGPFGPTQLGSVLGSLDALVVPSLWYENTPFTVLEALHARVPVIASDLGGIREVVDHGRNGLLFPAGDAAALAALLGRMAEGEGPALAMDGPQPPPIQENVDRLLALYRELGVATPAV